MGVNKVVFGAVSIMDISDSTVTADKLAKGETAYRADGEKIVGTMEEQTTTPLTLNYFTGTIPATPTVERGKLLKFKDSYTAEELAALAALSTSAEGGYAPLLKDASGNDVIAMHGFEVRIGSAYNYLPGDGWDNYGNNSPVISIAYDDVLCVPTLSDLALLFVLTDAFSEVTTGGTVTVTLAEDSIAMDYSAVCKDAFGNHYSWSDTLQPGESVEVVEGEPLYFFPSDVEACSPCAIEGEYDRDWYSSDGIGCGFVPFSDMVFAFEEIEPVKTEFYTQSKTVTPTTSQQTVTPDDGFDGLSKVTVNAMPTATQATPSIEVSTAGLITAKATQSAGYVAAGTKQATKQLTTQGAQTITPGTADKTIASGRYLTGTQTIKGDANLKAENIAEGVSIFGVAGTHSGGSGGGGAVETCTVTINMNGTYVAYTTYSEASGMHSVVDSSIDYGREITAVKGTLLHVMQGELFAFSVSDGITMLKQNSSSTAFAIASDIADTATIFGYFNDL